MRTAFLCVRNSFLQVINGYWEIARFRKETSIEEAVAASLATEGHAIEFVKDQYRHCKPILVLGAGVDLLEKAGIPQTLPSAAADPGLLKFTAAETTKGTAAFMAAIGKHRSFERQTDPPLV